MCRTNLTWSARNSWLVLPGATLSWHSTRTRCCKSGNLSTTCLTSLLKLLSVHNSCAGTWNTWQAHAHPKETHSSIHNARQEHNTLHHTSELRRHVGPSLIDQECTHTQNKNAALSLCPDLRHCRPGSLLHALSRHVALVCAGLMRIDECALARVTQGRRSGLGAGASLHVPGTWQRIRRVSKRYSGAGEGGHLTGKARDARLWQNICIYREFVRRQSTERSRTNRDKDTHSTH